MLHAPCFWVDPRAPGVLGAVGMLTLVLCSCSGQPASVPGHLPTSPSQEHKAGLVFIHMDSSLYSLPCSPKEMEVADPTYRWVREKADPQSLLVTEEGHLLFQHFQASDSGNYSCTISYMDHGLPVLQTFHYSIFGYHMPGGLEILLLFQSKLCEDEWTKRFLWDLHENLKQLETEQHCKLQFTTSSCFPSLNNPSDEFIIQVQLEVSFFGPNWDEHCKSQHVEIVTDCYRKTIQHNFEQVWLALTKFFKEHKSFHVTGAGISGIIFTNEFISFMETKHCNMGYGQTKQLQRCLDCCIVCPPGTFSPPKSLQCSSCPIGTYSTTYGVTFCTPCKDDMTTQVPGASSMSECVTERTEQAVSIIHRIPLLLLIILPPLLAINFLFILSSCYWFQQEYWMPSPTASKKAGISRVTEMVTKFFRIPREGPKPGSPAADDNNTSLLDTSHLDTSTSQGSDEEHTHGAPSPPSTPNFAALTDEGPAVLELEDSRNAP
eukprot:XP_012958194.2 zona pellucida-binding protein 2 [Anas platyrhynchos]